MIKKENIQEVFESRYIKVFDLQYAEGKHYFDATRRSKDKLMAVLPKEELIKALPDAVSMVVILKVKGEEPVILLNREYRYPVGQYLLSVPAGLIDEADKQSSSPLFEAAAREIKEEMGIELLETDSMEVVNPCLFSSPGMTDESNAIVQVVLNRETAPKLSQEGAEGTEDFDGILSVTRDEAISILKAGRDSEEIYYSVYTWIGLMCFVSGLWY